GGLVALANDGASHVVGAVASAPAWWIVWVAHTAAGARGASIGWPATAVGILVLTSLCAVVAASARRLLERPLASAALAAVTLLGVVQPWGRIGWPPRDWLLAMCDVGQGDAMAVRVAPGAAVVVDTGPDPRLVDRCLDDLDVDRVPLVVLTHFHADHTGGLSGVLEGREV